VNKVLYEFDARVPGKVAKKNSLAETARLSSFVAMRPTMGYCKME
jgi:hypothetical protein